MSILAHISHGILLLFLYNNEGFHVETQAGQMVMNAVWLKATPEEISALGDILMESGWQSTQWDFGSFDRAGFTLAGNTTQGAGARTFVCVVYDYERGRWSEDLKQAVMNYLAVLGVWDHLQGDSTARFAESIHV